MPDNTKHRKPTPEITATLCEEIAKGKSLNTIITEQRANGNDFPCMATIFNWLNNPDNSGFIENYTRAKQDQAEAGFEKIVDIVSAVERGDLDPNQGRVMIDAMKWVLGKLRPSKYSDKIQIDQDTNITIEVLNYPTKAIELQPPKLVNSK